jgi:uncharacterized HAD superfamily protein
VKDNVILTDVDGVLLNWEYAFDTWMQTHGHSKVEGGQFKYNIGKRYNISNDQGRQLIKYFNESAAIGFLPPLRDAMYYVKKLHEKHGFVFHAITSLSLDKNAVHLREMNLKKLFGETVFERIVCLDTGADKDDALMPYKDSGLWWVEDKIDNCLVGINLGLRSLLMEHGHNMDFDHQDIPRVKNWREVYDLVLGN